MGKQLIRYSTEVEQINTLTQVVCFCSLIEPTRDDQFPSIGFIRGRKLGGNGGARCYSLRPASCYTCCLSVP